MTRSSWVHGAHWASWSYRRTGSISGQEGGMYLWDLVFSGWVSLLPYLLRCDQVRDTCPLLWPLLPCIGRYGLVGPDRMIKVLSDAKCTPESLVLSLPFLKTTRHSVQILIMYISGIFHYTSISTVTGVHIIYTCYSYIRVLHGSN